MRGRRRGSMYQSGSLWQMMNFIGRRLLFLALFMLVFADICLADDDSYVHQLQKLAGQGDGESQFALALLYEHGEQGVMRDSEKALFWFLQAGQSGIPAACLYLGIKLENGSGVAGDPGAAGHWYCCAASKGWAMAQFFLAELYGKGKGRVQDKPRALAWYGLAEEQGYPGAKEAMAQLTGGMSNADLEKGASIRSEIRDFRAECPEL